MDVHALLVYRLICCAERGIELGQVIMNYPSVKHAIGVSGCGPQITVQRSCGVLRHSGKPRSQALTWESFMITSMPLHSLSPCNKLAIH